MLDLQHDGIVIPAQNGFEQLDVPFGSVRAATEATLGNILGEVSQRSENAECDGGPLAMTEYAGITLNFQDDKLVGYFARDPFVPQLTRTEMLSNSAVTMVEGSTLENEFAIGDPAGEMIGGFFASEADDAPVEALYAGMNCFAR